MNKNRKSSFEEELKKVREEKLDSRELIALDYLFPKVLRYVMYKMRTEKEVLKKFEEEFEKQESPRVKEEIFKYLRENDFINDKRYTELFLKESMNFKRNSVFELKMKLKQKGIDSEYIEDAASDLENELNTFEYNLIMQIIKERQRRNQDEQKIKAYLYRKGFNGENIKNAFLDYEEN